LKFHVDLYFLDTLIIPQELVKVQNFTPGPRLGGVFLSERAIAQKRNHLEFRLVEPDPCAFINGNQSFVILTACNQTAPHITTFLQLK
jgi:hypothetical protein